LTLYEQWLSGRRWEPVYVLRAIATQQLRETVATPSSAGHAAALDALLAVNDPVATAALSRQLEQGDPAAVRAAAAQGEPRSVARLVQQLDTTVGSAKTAAIATLGRVKGDAAIRALTPLLSDAQPLNRAAAAKALIDSQGPAAAASVAPLLQDPAPYVRLEVAGALYRIGDMRGLSLLQPLQTSDAASARLSAAGLMATANPGADWLGLVRGLLQEGDPLVRVDAARLLAPHDPSAARAALDALANDANLAIREEATRALPAALTDDPAGLRRLLRHPDALTSTQAAAKILALTATTR
jgi:HEAT repeat protein